MVKFMIRVDVSLSNFFTQISNKTPAHLELYNCRDSEQISVEQEKSLKVLITFADFFDSCRDERDNEALRVCVYFDMVEVVKVWRLSLATSYTLSCPPFTYRFSSLNLI